ncbi:regulation of nuclear pre-mRNA domain-containing protein, partial [Trifolium medium]|nr:regulation of nuclear pre-mRNA domain-containing protein [Trifolium medium]
VKPTNVKPMNVKLRPSAGNALDKIVSGYHHIYGGQTDEDAVLSKCRNAISSLEKADNDSNSAVSGLLERGWAKHSRR